MLIIKRRNVITSGIIWHRKGANIDTHGNHQSIYKCSVILEMKVEIPQARNTQANAQVVGTRSHAGGAMRKSRPGYQISILLLIYSSITSSHDRLRKTCDCIYVHSKRAFCKIYGGS
jgi:hypothetical protein